MRELKFRAWDIQKGRWNDDSDNYWRDGDCISDVDGVNYTLAMEDDEDEPKYIWEQYTGLKDKNGKEIYEGDIIQTNRGAREIGWNNEYSTFGIHESIDGFYAFCKLSNFEVIGNIHENPELIKGEE